MNTMKTLMLAAVTALSLGAGSAMSQEGGPSMPTVDFGASKTITVNHAAGANQIQAGSSDVSAPRGGAAVHFDYSDLANPG